jgi:hypothetical protein
MHIHGSSMNNQMMAIGATQRTQQAVETKRAAERVRKKLSAVATTDDEAVSRVEPYSEAEADARKKKSQYDPEAFRSVFFSLTV